MMGTITVRDEDGYFSITVDRGFGPRIAATVPTGNRAAYPEAVKRNMADAREKVSAFLADLATTYPDAAVVGWDESNADTDETSTARSTYMHDRGENKAMVVLGTGRSGGTVVRYVNALDDVTCTIDEKIMRCSPDFVAVCAHGYTANDSCPGCDADHDELIRSVELYGTQVSEHIGQQAGQPSIELGMIYQHADCTWSAVSPLGVVLGSNIVSSDSAVRALRLDHKVRVWRTALNDNVLHDARKLDEQAALSVDSNRQRVEDAVALLRACGITTGEQFERRLAALTEE